MDKHKLANTIDHTLLKPSTKNQITTLCNEAIQYGFASVCILPDYVKLARSILDGTAVKVCTVVGFPLGENTTATKVFETKNAIKNGAQEIDMVINPSYARQNQFVKVTKEIASVVKAAKGVTVKVIIEECLLNSRQIAKATKATIDGGAQFVKTSTGFSTHGATLSAVRIMAQTVKGTNVLIKAAGGIRDQQTALDYINAGASRIGTSNGVAIING
ncbi:MAG: deoxyribose-phosphate aldolase [Clostridia bacterium]|nr:deoxyribose-phosphate aldolase [Clostridia bacterium]